jgi:hypothetical protein
MRRVALALLGCAGAGCEGGSVVIDDPAGCADAALTVEIGTGQYTHEALADGDPVTIVNGPQGGWHVWTSGRLTATTSVVLAHASLVGNETGESLAGANDAPWSFDVAEPGLGSWDEATCTGEFYGQFAFVDDVVPPSAESYLDFICGLENRELTFTLTVTDSLTGEEASDTRTVRAVLDPSNVSYCHL